MTANAPGMADDTDADIAGAPVSASCEVFLDAHLGRWMVSFNGQTLESHRDRNAALKAARRVARLHTRATGESVTVSARDDDDDHDGAAVMKQAP